MKNRERAKGGKSSSPKFVRGMTGTRFGFFTSSYRGMGIAADGAYCPPFDFRSALLVAGIADYS